MALPSRTQKLTGHSSLVAHRSVSDNSRDEETTQTRGKSETWRRTKMRILSVQETNEQTKAGKTHDGSTRT